MRLVVIGGVAAGLSAAARARRLDRELEIIVLEKGARISYGACGLPYWFQGHVKSVDDLTLNTPDAFARERNIAIRTNCEVKAVRHVAREVDAESQLLRDVLDAIRPDAGAPSARMRALWTGTLAFDNDRYGPLDAKHVQLALDGLAIYDRTQAPLEVTK